MANNQVKIKVEQVQDTKGNEMWYAYYKVLWRWIKVVNPDPKVEWFASREDAIAEATNHVKTGFIKTEVISVNV